MKSTYQIIKIIFIAFIFISPEKTDAQRKLKEELRIENIELAYPCPAIPFYHFKAELLLPQSSIIEVEAEVNGKVLRYLNLHKAGEEEDPSRPAMKHRPPSGAGLSQDNTFYKDMNVIGWLKWQPGQNYQIQITVRMKESVQASPKDQIISAVRTLKAPEKVQVFDPAWKSYKSIVLTETAGIDRKAEPVEVLLAFYPDEANDLKRDIRVVAVDPVTCELAEVPSQVYDIQQYLTEDDLAPDENGKPTRNVPVWFPTVSARVAFMADVPARSSRIFHVYYNNPDAMVKVYKSDLVVQGEAPALQIDNKHLSIVLHPKSAQLDQITLKTKPDFPK